MQERPRWCFPGGALLETRRREYRLKHSARTGETPREPDRACTVERCERPCMGAAGVELKLPGRRLRGPGDVQLTQREVKPRAAIHSGLRPDLPTMPVDNPLHHRQPDPGPGELRFGVQPLERAE